MDDANINKGYSNFVIALLLLFPVVIGSVKIVGNLILLILVFMGIYILLKEKKSPFMVPELKLFSWITFSYFIVMLLSIVQNDEFIGELHHLARKVHFLLAPLVGLAIYKVNLPLDRLLISIKLGLITLGIIVIYQSQIIGSHRPSGMYNANVFGDIAVILFFFSLVKLYNENTKAILLTYISVIMGFTAIILSENRGTWVTFVFLLMLYVVFSFKHIINLKSRRTLILLIITICTLIAISFSSEKYTNRVSVSVEKVIDWSITSDSYIDSLSIYSSMLGVNSISSEIERLKMWTAGLSAAKDSPWIGYGYRNSTAAAQKYTDIDIEGYSHLHNEYITNLVSAGIIGLLSLMALLLLPLKLFLQSIKDKELFDYSLMGILLCCGYGSIGLTHIAFGEEHVNAIYIFFLAILLPSVLQIRERL